MTCVLTFTFATGRSRGQVPGDASGDGSVTLRDVALILAHLLGKSPLSGEALQRGDANGDGALDSADPIRIQADPLPPEKTFLLPGGAPLTLVKIPKGSFQMGSADGGWSFAQEAPVHAVTIGADYYMGKFEVTQRQWLAVIGSWPGPEPEFRYGAGDDFPAYHVSWNDIQDFEAAINGLGLGGTFRLPSEAEWEYAARGGTAERFYFGSSTCSPGSCAGCELNDYAWWCGNNEGGPGASGYGAKSAGGKPPNPFGLFDAMGNVWELVEDPWHSNYVGAPADGGPWNIPASSHRIIRGEVWNHDANYCRPAFRANINPDPRINNIGFRLAWTP